MQLLLCSKTQPIDGVGPAVSPLPKLLGCLGKRHAGCNSAIDNCLQMQTTKVIMCCLETYGRMFYGTCGAADTQLKWTEEPALAHCHEEERVMHCGNVTDEESGSELCCFN